MPRVALFCFVLGFFLHSSSQGVGACKIIKCDYNMTTYITNGPLLYWALFSLNSLIWMMSVIKKLDNIKWFIY